jgi:hypothetical protein
MINAARAMASGGTPLGQDGSTDYTRLASEERMVPAAMPWQEVAQCS